MSPEAQPLRMLFFPLMAAGHMIPMVDMAKLFAAHGVDSTIFTTPANALLIRPTIDRANRSGRLPHPISVLLVPFPSAAVGLPDGCENTSTVPSRTQQDDFMRGVELLRQPFDQALTELAPDCVVSDMFLPWTLDVATEHSIPRLVFHGTCFFALCARHSQDRLRPIKTHSFVLDGLPHRIEMLKSQIPDHKKSGRPAFSELFERMKDADVSSYGVVVNSFYELEPDYAAHYRDVVGRRAWHVGPVSLCNTDQTDQSDRGKTAAIDSKSCTQWLDSKRPGSVVYVCFGSWGEFTGAQLREMAIGLEASGHPFIWVVRHDGDDWLPDEYEERIRGRGMVIRGWAPQILILNHAAVGGFVTHCGWNSSLEGVSAGLAMVTWPLFAEQFRNERLLVDVLGIGVSVGVKTCAARPEDRDMVEAAEVERAVGMVMAGGEAAEARRRRAAELGEMARRAVEESGSSFVDVEALIKELMSRRTE